VVVVGTVVVVVGTVVVVVGTVVVVVGTVVVVVVVGRGTCCLLGPSCGRDGHPARTSASNPGSSPGAWSWWWSHRRGGGRHRRGGGRHRRGGGRHRRGGVGTVVVVVGTVVVVVGGGQGYMLPAGAQLRT